MFKKILFFGISFCCMLNVFAAVEQFTDAKFNQCIQYNNPSDFNKIAPIVESCKDTQFNIHKLALAKLIYQCNLTKPTIEQYYQTVIGEVANSVSSVKSDILVAKCYMLYHGSEFCNFGRQGNEKQVEEIKKFLAANDSDIKQLLDGKEQFAGKYVIGQMYQLVGDYPESVDAFIKSKYIDTALKVAIENKCDKPVIESCLQQVIDNVDYLKTPQRLVSVVDTITKLPPTYDGQVKTLLSMLNRVYYSKISESDQWKSAIVKLQLVLKAYGI